MGPWDNSTGAMSKSCDVPLAPSPGPNDPQRVQYQYHPRHYPENGAGIGAVHAYAGQSNPRPSQADAQAQVEHHRYG